MKTLIALLTLSTSIGVCLHSALGQPHKPLNDQEAIQRVITNFEQGWNRHDSKILAEQFHTDASWVNPVGVYSKGKRVIQYFYQTLHSTHYKASRITSIFIEDKLFVKPDVALIHVRIQETGDQRLPGQISYFRVTMMLTKRDDRWRILAGQIAKVPETAKSTG